MPSASVDTSISNQLSVCGGLPVLWSSTWDTAADTASTAAQAELQAAKLTACTQQHGLSIEALPASLDLDANISCVKTVSDVNLNIIPLTASVPVEKEKCQLKSLTHNDQIYPISSESVLEKESC